MLIGICGSLGSGKTLYMTRCLYKEWLKNDEREIATNYKLNGIPHRYIYAKELFDMKKTLSDMILGIDEMHIFLDCRSSGKNKEMTHFILQTRHLGMNLYFTTQDISQVDVRLRRMLDILVYCNRTPIKDFFKVKIIDYRDTMSITSNTFIFNGSPYYELYDTREIIDIR